MLLVALSIPLNYWLTKRYNVMGPAWGNLVALTVFNGIRFIMIYRIFRLQPFSWNHLWALGIGLVTLGIIYLLPLTGNIFIDVAIRSVLFIGIYGALILNFKVSKDIDAVFENLKARFLRLRR